MANSWHELDAGRLLPKAVRDALLKAGKAQDAVTNALAVLELALEIAATVAGLAAQDPIEAVLREAIAQAEAFLDGLIGKTTAHGIMIPIQKQYFGIGDPIPPDSIDTTMVNPAYNDLRNSGAIPIIKDGIIAPETISFINSNASVVGGNQGYYRTLIQSIQDSGDFAKPDFPSNYAVAGVSVIFGSKSLTDIYRIIALINKFLHLGLRADMGAGSQPLPSNLTYRIAPIPTEGRIGVQLDWTPLPLFQVKPLFSLEKAHIREIFVVRSTTPSFREAFAWGKVFPTEPTASQGALPSTPDTKVIARLTNDGFIKRYIDKDKTLKIGVAYYYALAIRYTIDGVVQPISNFSNVVRVFYNARPGSSRGGVPPDWYATASLAQMFPILQDLVSKLKLLLEGLLTRSASNNGIAQMLQQTVQQIKQLVEQAELINADLARLRALLEDLANADAGGIYTTSFSVKTGGIQAWTSELAVRMSNPAEPHRPPFSGGDLTAGFVLVAGAPNLPQLAGFVALIDLLFGSSEANPINKALDVLGTPTIGRTGVGFNKRMAPADAPGSTPPAGTGAPATDVTVILAPTPVVPTPVFDTKMQPTTTLPDC